MKDLYVVKISRLSEKTIQRHTKYVQQPVKKNEVLSDHKALKTLRKKNIKIMKGAILDELKKRAWALDEV